MRLRTIFLLAMSEKSVNDSYTDEFSSEDFDQSEEKESIRGGTVNFVQQMLEQVAPRITDKDLQRQAWRALAELAEQKGDNAQALACWKLSAKV